MQRKDIVIGTEYAETGPLAYGQEPRTTAHRIRFLATTPGYRLATRYKFNPDREYAKWEQVEQFLMDPVKALGYEDDTYRTRNDAWDRGEQEVVLLDRNSKDALPAERHTGHGNWVPMMVRPAAVHRTWERHMEDQNERKRKAEEAFRQRAPRAIEMQVISALSDALRYTGSRDEAIGYVKQVMDDVIAGGRYE